MAIDDPLLFDPEALCDRFVGCLLGGAIGDALGYPIEFVASGAEIARTHGGAPPARLAPAGADLALVSDDTQMTLFTAEGLIRARRAGELDPTRQVLSAYQRWLATQEMRGGRAPAPPRTRGLLLGDPRLHARRAPGNTCLSALTSSFMGKPAPTVATPPNWSKGCGAIMRSAPFGLAASTRQRAFRDARDAGVLTHGHPSGYLSAAYFAALVFDVARGAALDDAMRAADDLLAQEPEHAEVSGFVGEARRLAAGGPPSASAIERLGGGWTGEEALAIAIACARTASPDRIDEALWRSVAHGGDSDSTGSLTGNLLGATHGAAVLPARWLAELEMRDLLDRVARDLWAACIDGRDPGADAYPIE